MVRSGIFKTPTLAIPLAPVFNLDTARSRLRLLPDSLGASSSPRQPYKGKDGIRFHANDLSDAGSFAAESYSDFVELSDHLCAQILNAQTRQTVASKYLGDDWLKLEYWISGKVSLVFREFGQIDFDGRWCFAYLHRDQIEKGEWVHDCEPCTSVTIYCKPAYLERTLGDEVERLPPAFRQFATGRAPTGLFEVLPMTPDVGRAVMAIANATHIGSLRRLYVEAKVMELFSAAMDALYARSENRRDEFAPTCSERRRLTELRDFLLEHLASPPGTAVLARMAAMNQQKLQLGFKQLFGQTVFDYCQEQRLERARGMLEKSDLTVTQIALDSGYDFANNFSSAFKRRYGLSPRAYRRKF